MPPANVYFYRESPGDVPVLDWLKELRNKDQKAFANCVARIRMLAALGHELRRPHADTFRGGIRELRAKRGHVNYRILYFAHGRDLAILAHALTKQDKVPDADIERAIARRKRFEKNPAKHTAEEEIPGA